MNAPRHHSDSPDDLDTICDKCGEPVSSDESQNGPEGTEWEHCNLCNDCYAEVLP